MNIQDLISSVSQGSNGKGANEAPQSSNPLEAISSMFPGGLVGGAAAGGVMALLMGSKSSRKMAKKVAAYGGTAVVGGLAYKAFDNWQKNKALAQTQPINNQDIGQAGKEFSQALLPETASVNKPSLDMILIKTMIAASKADGNIDAAEHKHLFETIEKLGFDAQDKAAVFDAMGRDISIEEIASSVESDEHKAEVYLSAYLAIEVDNQEERTFLNNLANSLALPEGFPAYLEQQASQGMSD